MSKALTDLRRRAALLFPDASNIEPGWLQKAVNLDSELLRGVQKSRHASRLLRRSVSDHYRLVVPQRDSLRAEQQWVLMTHNKQRQLAKMLGVHACKDFIRTAITRAAVTQLRDCLGEEIYQQTLHKSAHNPDLTVAGLRRDSFDQALIKSQPGRYLTAHGIALLEQTLDNEDPFFVLRMRFAFSPACWNMRPPGLSANMAQLKELIVRLSGKD